MDLGAQKKKPGWPKGKPRGSYKTIGTEKIDLGALSATLISLHAMAALAIPEMKIEEQEARMLAEAIARVERHYPAISGVLTGKLADHVALGGAVLMIYGTRLVAIRNRMMEENKPAPAPPPNVTVMPRPQAPGQTF